MTEETVNRIVTIADRYLTIEGYFTRGDEISIRASKPLIDKEWQEPLKAELKQEGFRLKISQQDLLVYLNIYPASSRIPWINILLFLATILSVSFMPAFLLEGDKVFRDFGVILEWQRFAIPLILILLFHEFGHYLAARRRGIRVSLPYFLPSPFVIGTFGAFIKSKSPFLNRRDLLEVGAYGPIAGFVVAIIFLGIGLSDLTYRQTPQMFEIHALIEPLIMKLMMFLFQGGSTPEGCDIFLQDNQMLFAAWVGIVVTMINLLPVGQLDGGHIIYAMFPRQHRKISLVVFIALLCFGFIWEGWWLWGVLLFFIVRFKHPPTLDDRQPLDPTSRRIGWIAIIIFLLTFTPVPF